MNDTQAPAQRLVLRGPEVAEGLEISRALNYRSSETPK